MDWEEFEEWFFDRTTQICIIAICVIFIAAMIFNSYLPEINALLDRLRQIDFNYIGSIGLLFVIVVVWDLLRKRKRNHR
jgi:ribose/xylose/arabinose/galactoside ABC-type transport system permease subunit